MGLFPGDDYTNIPHKHLLSKRFGFIVLLINFKVPLDRLAKMSRSI